MVRSPALALFAATLVLLAGCIALPQDGAAPNADPQARSGREMTATERQNDKSDVCTDGGLGLSDRFCATRTITVTGKLAGFDLLDIDLETFNGAITIKEASGDAWGFVATLKARGATAAEATRAIDDIDFTWAHEDGAGHFVEVVAEHQADTDGRSVAIELTFPRAVAMRLVASTSNGAIELAGVRTDGASLATSNGKIVARGDVTHVDLTTSNGAIEATLRPVSPAQWSLATSNGKIDLKVPEGDAYGYQFSGTTSNGEVDYTLRDGTKGSCPEGSQYYTPPCDQRSFHTRNYDRRDVQVTAILTTSNGEINVGPS